MIVIYDPPFPATLLHKLTQLEPCSDYFNLLLLSLNSGMLDHYSKTGGFRLGLLKPSDDRSAVEEVCQEIFLSRYIIYLPVKLQKDWLRKLIIVL